MATTGNIGTFRAQYHPFKQQPSVREDPEMTEFLERFMEKALRNKHVLPASIEDVLGREHNTNLQMFLRDVLVPILEWYAGQGYTDARNKASKRWAVAALEATENIGLPLI